MTKLTTNEKKALEVGSNSVTLRKRLMATKQVLCSELQAGFGKGVFDFISKTLTGNNGVVLKWFIRQHPDQPISYENQQTNVGTVKAYW